MIGLGLPTKGNEAELTAGVIHLVNAGSLRRIYKLHGKLIKLDSFFYGCLLKVVINSSL